MEIDDFLSWLEVERRGSAHTVEAYGRDLRQFSDWLCADGSPFDAGSVTVSDVRAWMGALASEGLKAVTLRRKVQSVRAFYNWAMKTGRLERNPAADVTLPKKRRKLPEIIREKDMEEVLDADPSGFRAQRAHLVLSMLYSLGLRQAELLGLDDDDIDLRAGELKVTGKRAKQRRPPAGSARRTLPRLAPTTPAARRPAWPHIETGPLRDRAPRPCRGAHGPTQPPHAPPHVRHRHGGPRSRPRRRPRDARPRIARHDTDLYTPKHQRANGRIQPRASPRRKKKERRLTNICKILFIFVQRRGQTAPPGPGSPRKALQF